MSLSSFIMRIILSGVECEVCWGWKENGQLSHELFKFFIWSMCAHHSPNYKLFDLIASIWNIPEKKPISWDLMRKRNGTSVEEGEKALTNARAQAHTHTKLSVFPLRTKSANSQKILFNRFDVSSGQFFISTLFITSYDESHKFIQFQKWSRNIPNIPFPLLHHCCFFLPVCWC